MEHHKFFKNDKCRYFPCHNIKNPENFNCLFCYCPLYALGDKCAGNFIYTEKGMKSCRSCGIPHTQEGYNHIISHISDIINIASKK